MPIILRPKHFPALWNGIPNEGRTPETYRMRQRDFLREQPAKGFAPHLSALQPQAYVGNGAWRIHCPCGEATHADPEWKLSCCFGCGTIYEHVMFPSNWREIEALLVKRPIQSSRNWQLPETLEYLTAEQKAHGDPV